MNKMVLCICLPYKEMLC